MSGCGSIVATFPISGIAAGDRTGAYTNRQLLSRGIRNRRAVTAKDVYHLCAVRRAASGTDYFGSFAEVRNALNRSAAKRVDRQEK